MKYLNFLIRNRKAKLTGMLLFLSTIIQATIEVLSLFVTYKLIEDNDKVFVEAAYEFVSIQSFGLIVIALLLASGFLKLILTFHTTKYSQLIRKDLTNHFFQNIKHLDIEDFSKYGRANYQKDLFAELDNLTANFVQPIFLVVSPIVLCLAYSVFGLAALGPNFIFLFFGLLLLYGFYFVTIMGTLKNFGSEHVSINSTRNKELLNIINNVKNYKLGNVQLKHIESLLSRLAIINSKIFLSMQLPKVVLDILLFSMIVVLVLFSNNDVEKLFQDLIFVFLVTSRLIPPAQAIYNTASAIRVGFPSLVHLFERYSSVGSGGKLPNISQFENLSFQVNNNTVHLEKLDLSRPGVYHIQGASGSGKTTLINILTGLMRPDQFIGTRLEYSTMILTSDNYVPEQTAYDLFGISYADLDTRHLELFSILKLDEIILSSFENFLISSSADNISTGQRQRLVIFSAFVKNLDLLVLDEATSGFSMEIEADLLEFLSKQNIIVFFVTHRHTKFDFKEVIKL
jgi:ABC-type bacteriocin/lantibiotic exporter with double-glycine peptidase domain